MEDVIINFTADQFLQSTEPYDYLVSIENPMQRDREMAAYKKFAQRACSISASTFKAAVQRAYAERHRDEQDGGLSAQVTRFTGQALALKCPGYSCSDNGIWRDSAFGPTLVLSHPIMPVRRIVNVDTGECKTLIAFRTGRTWREQIVSREALSSRVKIVQQLSSTGAYVTSENCPGVISFLADVENANIDELPVSHSASRMGWVDGDRFLPYENDLMFDGDQRFGEMYRSITEHGDRDKWFELVASVRRGRSIEARVMLAASFASVLIKPLSGLSFVVHCWSDVSGTGKTVALMLAASVWADPNDGGPYIKNMNTTNAAVEMVAGFLNSLPMCLDELCSRDRRDSAENLVYMICENAGRSRASRNGGIQAQQRWRNCAITTGETPILGENSRAGAENRVIDLEVNAELFDDPISAANTVRENYGFAGKIFLDYLRQNGALETVRQYYDNYLTELRGTGATAKQAIPMALILAADRFVALHLFNDVHNLSVRDVASLLKSNEQVDTNRRAYDWLMGTIAENNGRFEPTADNYNGPVWGKLDDSSDNVVACIIRSRFTALLRDAGFNDRSFLKWAKRNNIVDTSEAGEPTKPVRISGVSKAPVRCVCLKMNALDKPAQNRIQQVDVDLPF